jgi:hypothetical protein
MFVRRTSARRTQVLILAALLSAPAAAQTRTTVAFGPAWLDFTISNVGALSAQLRLQRGPAELSALAVMPLGQTHAIPDCLPNASCEERSTPSALLGGVASLSSAVGSGGLRASAGIGAIAAAGVKGSGSKSSAVGSLGLDWARANGRGLTFGVRALGLASSIAGMRYAILPSLGVRF